MWADFTTFVRATLNRKQRPSASTRVDSWISYHPPYLCIINRPYAYSLPLCPNPILGPLGLRISQDIRAYRFRDRSLHIEPNLTRAFSSTSERVGRYYPWLWYPIYSGCNQSRNQCNCGDPWYLTIGMFSLESGMFDLQLPITSPDLSPHCQDTWLTWSQLLYGTESSIVMAEQINRDVVDQTLSGGEPSPSDVPASTNDNLSLIHIWRCRRYAVCRSRLSPDH